MKGEEKNGKSKKKKFLKINQFFSALMNLKYLLIKIIQKIKLLSKVINFLREIIIKKGKK